ncbi:MAG TPA: undecaprenyl-diphosphate phosphatase [Candidatus Omnitrophota bacterium]|nr:undecaprenyl-diphosphate phosphatase [Candidatus Omnitrophota bacterium]
MNLLDALLLGIVEGITEFLPISSTGHLILSGRLLGLSQTEFLKSFDIAIQLGAILAVVILYWKKLLVDFRMLTKIATAFLPTAILGLGFYKIVKQFLLSSESVVLWSLFLGGVFIIVFEMLYKERKDAAEDVSDISYRQAFLIGIFQSVAMIPGVSRAAATIFGGLSLGLKRKTIVEFSFLLAVPTMLAATGLDLIKSAGAFSRGDFVFLGTGFLASFLVAILGIKFLIYFIKNNNFIPFGIYRIALALIFWFAP